MLFHSATTKISKQKIEGVTFGYDAGNPLFSNVHFGVDLDSRVGIVGPNGAGKSTLLNLILDKLRPLSGEVRRNPNLRIAHFTQHAAEQFDYRLNSVDNMIKLFPGVQEQVGCSGCAHLSMERRGKRNVFSGCRGADPLRVDCGTLFSFLHRWCVVVQERMATNGCREEKKRWWLPWCSYAYSKTLAKRHDT